MNPVFSVRYKIILSMEEILNSLYYSLVVNCPYDSFCNLRSTLTLEENIYFFCQFAPFSQE
jgi:hypothetical protein